MRGSSYIHPVEDIEKGCVPESVRQAELQHYCQCEDKFSGELTSAIPNTLCAFTAKKYLHDRDFWQNYLQEFIIFI